MSENDRVVAMIGGIMRTMKYTLVVNRGFAIGTWDLALYQDVNPKRIRAQVAGSLYAALCYLRDRCIVEGFGEDIDWGVEEEKGNTDGQGQTGTYTDGEYKRMIQAEQMEKLWEEEARVGCIPMDSARLGMSHVSEARANEMERIAGKANCEAPLKLVVSLKPWTLEDELLFQSLWQRREKLSGKGRVEP